jgi:hypothetical protein
MKIKSKNKNSPFKIQTFFPTPPFCVGISATRQQQQQWSPAFVLNLLNSLELSPHNPSLREDTAFRSIRNAMCRV